MRIVLVGAVESTRVAFEALATSDSSVLAGIVTLPTSFARRHSDWCDLRPLASRYGLPVIEAADINSAAILHRIQRLSPDYVVVVGWSQVCRVPFLNIPRIGVIGYHPSLLPDNRGRAVIPWTILRRCHETGATLFWMDEGIDSGDILLQERFAVEPAETAGSLYRKHLGLLESLLHRALPCLASGSPPPRHRQDHASATYCAQRLPADGLIDWSSSSSDVDVLIRASGSPYPGAFTFLRGRRVVVWRAEYIGAAPYYGLPGQVQDLMGKDALVCCGDGEHVLLQTVQPEEEPAQSAGKVLRRHDRLGIDWLQLAEALGKLPK